MKTPQIEFWSGDFGREYTDRSTFTPESWDDFYRFHYGHTKLEMNADALKDLPKDARILEVGCNIGLQLLGFQRMGFTQLYGIELQLYAVEKSKSITTGIQIIQGSGFDLPFKDGFFDLVCTNGVLIHIAPDDHHAFMSEIVRCSRRFVMGYEYHAPELTKISYRGHDGFLWKTDFAKRYTSLFPELTAVYERVYPYIHQQESGNQDSVFVLEKRG
jgi:pseudaminic acid biosynthesis-associated methylase